MEQSEVVSGVPVRAWQGRGVRLRAFEPSDVEALVAAESDGEAARHADVVGVPRSAEAVAEWVARVARQAPDAAKGEDVRLAIENDQGALVGAINTHRCNVRAGTFFYGLGIFAQHRRRGYAKEAVRILLRHYFDELRYQKCTVEIYAFNPPSVTLHERLGFVHEGRLRRMVYSDGAYHDLIQLGITAEEFAAADRAW